MPLGCWLSPFSLRLYPLLARESSRCLLAHLLHRLPARSPSWFNADEAATVLDYVEQLLQFRRSRVTPEQIGVITPFAKQAATPRAQPATPCRQPATPCTQACNPRTQPMPTCDRALRHAGAQDRDAASRTRPHAGGRWRQGGRRRELPGAGAHPCVLKVAALPMPACSPTSRCTPAALSVQSLQPYQRAPATVCTRSARPSSSRRCARRWASSSYNPTLSLTLTQPSPNPNLNSNQVGQLEFDRRHHLGFMGSPKRFNVAVTRA